MTRLPIAALAVRTGWLAILAAGVLGALPAPAPAGLYRQTGCSPTSRGTAGWDERFTASRSQFPRLTVTNQCAGGGELGATHWGERDVLMPAGGGAGWRYQASPGTEIRGIALKIRGWTTIWEGQIGDVAVRADGAVLASFPQRGVFDAALSRGDLHAPNVEVIAGCATPCATEWSLAWMAIRDIEVTLGDDLPPVATGAVDGTLAADATLQGRETIEVAATDVGGGVRELRLSSDGTVVWTAPFAQGTCQPLAGVPGDWTFSAPRPCPPAASVSAGFDTNQLADGRHVLALDVVDAAGNTTRILRADRAVANHPPVNLTPPAYAAPPVAGDPAAGQELRAERGTWSGPDLAYEYQWQRCSEDGRTCTDIPDATALVYTPGAADAGQRLRLAVTARNVVSLTKVTPLTGVVRGAGVRAAGARNGVVSGGRDCSEDGYVLRTPDNRDGLVRVPYRAGARARVQVELTCAADGRAVAEAALRLSAAVPGVADPVGGTVRTDAKGRAELSLPTSASRTVAVTYRAREDDAAPSASVIVRLVVRGRMTLSVRQLGTVASFRGRLVGGHVPARGVTVQLQWRDGARWRPVANLSTDRRGRFRYAYRFSDRARGFRYRFRAIVTPGQLDYPYAPGRSPVRSAGPG